MSQFAVFPARILSPGLTSRLNVADLRVRDEVFSDNLGDSLLVVGTSYGRVPAESVLDGSAKPIEATLSADGRSWAAEWHRGPESGSAVYVERIDESGVAFHGFVDSISRRIVQAG